MKSGRFSINERAELFWQENATNPMPGIRVGQLSKGESICAPRITMDEPHNDAVFAQSAADWLVQHMAEILDPMMGYDEFNPALIRPAVPATPDVARSESSAPLETPELNVVPESQESNPSTDIAAKDKDASVDGSVDNQNNEFDFNALSDSLKAAHHICQGLKNALGVVERSTLKAHIDQLDNEGRNYLRSQKVRLGPQHVFVRNLLKPAAIRLKAVLWALFHGGDMPAQVPHDGAVSSAQDHFIQQADYACAIGYPVYGPRAIRVDMLDRLISAVYERSKNGRFRAQHDMAEWLGCSIDTLYDVLTALGHKKIDAPDPATKEEKSEAVPEEAPEVSVTAAAAAGDDAPKEVVTEVAVECKSEGELKPAEKPVEKPVEKPAPEQKPELAEFMIKQFAGHGGGAKRHSRKNGGFKPKTGDKKPGKKSAPGLKNKGVKKSDGKKPGKKESPGDLKPLAHSPFASMLSGLKSDKK